MTHDTPETSPMPNWTPLIVTVAPNGARKTKADHPALPITAEELAVEALRCHNAGAAMIHLHVRDEAGGHSLSVEAYRAAIAAIRDRVGDDLLIQVTSEAAGVFGPVEQMEMVRRLKPDHVSLALREIVADATAEAEAAAFLQWLGAEGVTPQYILYSPEDVSRFLDLRRRNVVPGRSHSLLFVLGRYGRRQARPEDLLPFLEALGHTDDIWSVCAFGGMEHACVAAAIALGGHARVGFENNMILKDGAVAPNNAPLVAQVGQLAAALGRPLADARTAHALLTRELAG